MIVKLYKGFFNNDKEKRLPNHLLKINFIILNISEDWDEVRVRVKVESHPTFTTRKGFTYCDCNWCVFSGKSVSYKKDVLVGMEFVLLKECFFIVDIINFENWNQGDTF